VIVRILGEGQYELPDDAEAELDELDHRLDAAVEANDEAAFAAALGALIAKVRSSGTHLGHERLVPSDLALPAEGSTLAEVMYLIESEVNAEL
jgi:hypothetical protein